MAIRIKRGFCLLLTAVLLFTVIQEPVFAMGLVDEQEQLAAGTGSASVTTCNEFLTALAEKKSPIIVEKYITVSDGTEESGRMKPVMIPENTVIKGGTAEGSGLNFRSPVQLEGDGVSFQDMELTFESSTALGSVAHREIFLAGHSLTLDNVSTYLEGDDGSLGGFAGDETELLPTVYGGGYPGTEVGNNASLTIQNSNAETILQGIYMGHGAETDNKVPYSGSAVLNLDTKVIVRDGIYTDKNSKAAVTMSGSGMAKTVQFYGDGNTTLTIRQSEVSQAVTDGIGHIILEDEATLAPTTDSFRNITVRKGGCLDLDALTSAVITGDFTGGTEEEKGFLILETEGTLTIQGTVSGITQFQTGHKRFPGALASGRKYIVAKRTNETDVNFVLANANIELNYVLEYDEDGWTALRTDMGEEPVIESIEVEAPAKVNLNRIWKKTDDSTPDAAGACKIVWKDAQGNAFDTQTVEDYGFYEIDYIIGIKTEYWESNDPEVLERTDWYNAVFFESSTEIPNTYYLTAYDGAKTGNYTFLFCSDYYTKNPITVADVKALSSTVKKEVSIEFCDTDPQPEVKPNPQPDPQPEVKPDPQPEHSHKYTETVTKEATCTQKGEKVYQCSCGKSYIEEIPLKPHRPVTLYNKASLEKDGSMIEKCSVCQRVLKQEKIYRLKSVTLSTESYTYDGKSKKPRVKVKDSQGKTVSSNQYQVSYKDNKNVGKASVTVRFKGNYSGSKKLTFTILPKETSLLKLTAKSKGISLKWQKQTSQTTGYILQYSTSKSFSAKATKSLTIKKTKTKSKTINKLKANKKYYVRIRTYKTVKVNGKSVNMYSKWSKAKAVTTKKR